MISKHIVSHLSFSPMFLKSSSAASQATAEQQGKLLPLRFITSSKLIIISGTLTWHFASK